MLVTFSATPSLATAVRTITYEEYATILTARLTNQEHAGLFDAFKSKLLQPLIAAAERMKEEFGVKVEEILYALKQRKVFDFLKRIGFRLSKLLTGVQKALGLIHNGLVKVISAATKSGAFQKLRAGTLKVDEFLNQYPLLKKLTGVVLAGFLLWCWLSMSFTGDFSSDMDLTGIADAFLGRVSVTDVFASVSGIENLILTAFGLATGISFPWLGANVYNIVVALAFSGAKRAVQMQMWKNIKRPIMRA